MKKLQKRNIVLMNTVEANATICICDCWMLNAKYSVQAAPRLI